MQGDCSNDLLHLQPMMAGRIPLHRAPNHLPSRFLSALLDLPICAVSHHFPLVSIQSRTHSLLLKPAVLTRSSPAINRTHTSPTILFARPRYITPSSAFSNQGRLQQATFHSDPGHHPLLPEILDPAQNWLSTGCTRPFRFAPTVSDGPHKQTLPAPKSVRKPTPHLFILFSIPAFQTTFWQM